MKSRLFPGFEYFRDVYISLFIIALIAITGTLGFMNIESLSFTESLYMTIITVTTVGFKEVTDLSTEGRYFTIFLIFISFGTFAYALSSITKSVITGRYKTYLKKFKMDQKIARLENHFIVCGYGNNGKSAAAVLASFPTPVVIIEKDEDIAEKLREQGIMHVAGDATDDSVLEEAGIKKATALIATLPNDTENVFVTLSSRELNPKLRIIARCTRNASQSKLRIAGADQIIMPDKVGGKRMAGYLVNQNIYHFLDKIAISQHNETHIFEFNSEALLKELENTSIGELKSRLSSDCILIGAVSENGKHIVNPSSDIRLDKITALFFLGNPHEIENLKKKIDSGEF